MNWIQAHFVLVFVLYYVFSAAVGAMPPPTATSSTFYTWMHGFLHILAGNITSAISAKFPNLPAGATLQTTTVQQTTAVAESTK